MFEIPGFLKSYIYIVKIVGTVISLGDFHGIRDIGVRNTEDYLKTVGTVISLRDLHGIRDIGVRDT